MLTHTNTHSLSLYLKGLDQDEDVVHAHSQHQEGDDLDDDQRGRLTHKAEEPQAGGHRQQHNHHTAQAHRDLGINLLKTRTAIVSP